MTRIDTGSSGLDAWRNGLDRLAREGGSDSMQRLFEQRAAELRQQYGAADLGVSAADDVAAQNPLSGSTMDAVRAVDSEVRTASTLTEGLLTGKVDSPHEVAATIRRADLTLKFSMEIRNRLVDAYREVMRMSV